MIYNNGNNIIQLGGVNQAWDASQMVYQYYKQASGSPTPPAHDYSQDYLTFEALESGTFAFSKDVSYSTDDGANWNTLSASTPSPTVNSGDKILFKASITPSYDGIGGFSSTGRFNVMGNPYSLLYEDSFQGITDLTGKSYAAIKLFANCTGLISAENLSLPATTLSNGCYASMFSGCTSLTTPPELPATTLAMDCYAYMFQNCYSLTTAPALPATTLANGCYGRMFLSCTSLTVAPELPATTLAQNCYSNMFNACPLTTAPVLSATTLEEQCYFAMFAHCTALTTAPALPATTLATGCYYKMFLDCPSLTTAPELGVGTLVQNCYNEMFKDCTSLNSVRMLATDISASGCLSNWLYNVSATGTLVKNSSMTSLPSGGSGIPTGWTVVDAS